MPYQAEKLPPCEEFTVAVLQGSVPLAEEHRSRIGHIRETSTNEGNFGQE